MTLPPSSQVCLLELWGLGDATMMTAFLRNCEAGGVAVTLLCKPGTKALLEPSFPDADYLLLEAPWTAFRGKYRLWRWPWLELFRLLLRLRRRHFDAAISVRRDPRDHLLMFLMAARRRVGFRKKMSGTFLTDVLEEPAEPRPVAEDWMAIQKHVFPSWTATPPALKGAAYAASLPPALSTLPGPIFGLHTGARIRVRRWDIEKFRELLARLRKTYRFSLVLMPDVDGYGGELDDLADLTLSNLSLPAMTASIGHCDLLLCNDSAPGHIADALGVPVVTVFGPTHPVRFRPYASENLVLIRDICPHRPCFDYCRFPEPYCLTRLEVEEIWPEVRAHIESLIDAGVLPIALSKVPRTDVT